MVLRAPYFSKASSVMFSVSFTYTNCLCVSHCEPVLSITISVQPANLGRSCQSLSWKMNLIHLEYIHVGLSLT